MQLLRTLFFIAILSAAAYGQESKTLRMADMEGVWFVNLTDFPMWTSGKKQNPRFKYTKISDTKMLDEVTYEKKGKTKTIVGYDERSSDNKEGYIWKGKGLKSLFSSEWKVIHYNAKYEIAVLHFEKTLFTPAGYDVISRKKSLNPKILAIIRQLLPTIGVSSDLKVIQQA